MARNPSNITITSELLELIMKEKGQNKSKLSRETGISMRTIHRIFNNESISIEHLKLICKALNCHPMDIMYDELFDAQIGSLINNGFMPGMSLEDKRDWAEIDYRDHDLIDLLKDFGYVIEPMKDGHTDYSGKEITNSISNADTFALFNRIYEFIETELKQFDHQQFLNWAKEGTNISFSSDEYEIIHKDEHGVVVRKRHGKQEK